MNIFKITWPTKKVEHVIQEAADTLEAFLNIHFGSMWEAAQEAGVEVEHLVGDAAKEALDMLGIELVEPEAEPVVEQTVDQQLETELTNDPLTTYQLEALNTTPAATLTTEQINTLTTEQVAALTATGATLTAATADGTQ